MKLHDGYSILKENENGMEIFRNIIRKQILEIKI